MIYYVDRGGEECPPPEVAQRAMIVVRGLPGTPRKEIAKSIAAAIPESVIISADDYFTDHRGHNFPFRTHKPTRAEIFERNRNPRAFAYRQLRDAYRACVAAGRAAVEKRLNVIVDNPTVRAREWKQWGRMIDPHKEYSFFIVDGDSDEDIAVLSRKSNIAPHTLERMDEAWEETPGREVEAILVECEGGTFEIDGVILEDILEIHSGE